MQPALAPRPNPSAQPIDHAAMLRDQPEHLHSNTHSHIVPPPPTYQTASNTMSSQHSTQAPASPSATSVQQMSEHSDGDNGPSDGRKGFGKRELSTSKRAAQNRAAQRAFRQRKEGYIKKLEEQVRDYQVLSENFKAVQSENYQLRDYIINLQSRLLESQHEVPPPPSNVDGLQPGKAHQPQPLQLHAVNAQQHLGQQLQQTVTNSSTTPPQLPRIAEMNRPSPPRDHTQQSPILTENYGFEQAAKRLKTSPTMTPAQNALQGPAVMNQSPSR